MNVKVPATKNGEGSSTHKRRFTASQIGSFQVLSSYVRCEMHFLLIPHVMHAAIVQYMYTHRATVDNAIQCTRRICSVSVCVVCSVHEV